MIFSFVDSMRDREPKSFPTIFCCANYGAKVRNIGFAFVCAAFLSADIRFVSKKIDPLFSGKDLFGR